MAMQKSFSLELLNLAARTASGSSDSFPVDYIDEMLIFTYVTAASGTSPTLDIVYQAYDGTNWVSHSVDTQITGPTGQVLRLTNVGLEGRIYYAIGGTSPSFTFRVTVQGKSLG